ncbi:MAG: lysoplasmalogenase family protein [Clostridia bacterium]
MLYIVLSIVLIWLVLMPLHFRSKAWHSKVPTRIAKVVPTLIAAAFAAYACFFTHTPQPYAMLVFIGLCICTLADLMIEIRFEVGGALFFIGHVFYVAALAFFRMFSWQNAMVFVAAVALLLFFILRYRAQLPHKLLLYGLITYSLALSALLALSLPLPFMAYSTSALCAAVGAALFVASDMTLCHNTLCSKPVPYHFFSLGLYYMGQLFLALSTMPRP